MHVYGISIFFLISINDTFCSENEYYDAPVPTQTSRELSNYLDFLNNPNNKKKLQFHSDLEKEILFYFSQLSEEDQKEMIAFAKIKAQKNTSHT